MAADRKLDPALLAFGTLSAIGSVVNCRDWRKTCPGEDYSFIGRLLRRSTQYERSRGHSFALPPTTDLAGDSPLYCATQAIGINSCAASRQVRRRPANIGEGSRRR
jgi:hypothetical protein